MYGAKPSMKNMKNMKKASKEMPAFIKTKAKKVSKKSK
jgi:hypothetical protein